VLVIACYGFSLRLPFYFDDLPKFSWLGGHDLLDIWTTSSENDYYRPLGVTTYELGLLLPKGVQQVVLHALNLLFHWGNAVLLLCVIDLLNVAAERSVQAVLAAALFAVFPFFFRTIPWVTASFHLLVIMLTLVAVYAALRAERDDRAAWWRLSLLATALAPFAHENGFVCGAIVGGIVTLHYGLRGILSPLRRLTYIVLGGLLNVAAFMWRSLLPGTGAFNPDGLNSWFPNVMFALHGLVYPVGPAIGWLVRRWGWHDFTLVQVASASTGLLFAWLAVRGREARWIARGLWWWFCGLLPAVVRFRYGGLVNSPRFYALASIGIVMLWSRAIVELGKAVRPAWARRLVWVTLAGAILMSNVVFLGEQRRVHLTLGRVYGQIMDAAQPENAPLGFVNVPAWLALKAQTYALTKDGMVGLPLYTNVWELIGVNVTPQEADNVMFVHTLYEPEDAFFGFHGDWLDWAQMRQFAVDHRTVWLIHYEEKKFDLRHVGSIRAGERASFQRSLARFEGGPAIERASAQEMGNGQWAVTLTWLAPGPVEGNIFVHVVDTNHNLVAQADGPALGGMVPLSLWQPGDLIYDVRYLTVPEGGGPYTVLVGVYRGNERFPAFIHGARCTDDAAPVATIAP
jgi:hypothetical protein